MNIGPSLFMGYKKKHEKVPKVLTCICVPFASIAFLNKLFLCSISCSRFGWLTSSVSSFNSLSSWWFSLITICGFFLVPPKLDELLLSYNLLSIFMFPAATILPRLPGRSFDLHSKTQRSARGRFWAVQTRRVSVWGELWDWRKCCCWLELCCRHWALWAHFAATGWK